MGESIFSRGNQAFDVIPTIYVPSKCCKITTVLLEFCFMMSKHTLVVWLWARRLTAVSTFEKVAKR